MVAKIVTPFIFLFVFVGCKTEQTGLVNDTTHQMSIEDFSFLIGSWDGALEYLNFGDDKTRVSLPTRATYTQRKDKISYKFIYTEPNGSEVEGKGSINMEGDNFVKFNGSKHKVVDKVVDAQGGLMEVRLTRMGKDNDREAQIDHVFKRENDAVTITRYILLEGATDPFVRHTYTFQRDGNL